MNRRIISGLTVSMVLLLCLNTWPSEVSQVSGQSETNKAAPGSDVDPKSIMQASVEACLKVKTVEYVFDQETATDNGPGYNMPRITATLRQERADVPRSGLPGKYQATGTITLPPGAPARMGELMGMKPGERTSNFGYAYDGASFQILNPLDSTVLLVKPPEPRTIVQLHSNAGVNTVGAAEFTDPAPFKRVLDRNPTLTYHGLADIGGVQCHVIHGTRTAPSRGNPEQMFTFRSRYYIGTKDFLPRRVVNGTIQHTIRIIKINEPFGPDAFTLKTPGGYSVRAVTDAEPRARSTGLLAVGTPAPEWKLRDAGGREHSLSDYRGKVVVMDFWATWCGPCIKAMPSMQALHEKFAKDGVVVIGISSKEGPDSDPIGFTRKKGYTYQFLLEGDPIVPAYHAEALPTLYIIGKDGKVIHADRGYAELAKDELTAIIERYLKDGSVRTVFERRN